ncbi:MAG TPA: hypothetical protein VFQ39_02920 [Longimicrobium sp.]|nr:hypothetical protein [Longimicrobium sp.]
MTISTDGIYIEAEPVEVIEGADPELLSSAIERAHARGNATVGPTTRSNFPKAVVLNYVRVRSWNEFEKKAESWSLSWNLDSLTVTPTQPGPYGGFEEDAQRAATFSGRGAVAHVVQEILRSD